MVVRLPVAPNLYRNTLAQDSKIMSTSTSVVCSELMANTFVSPSG